jgi:uncharacterized RDD family membrane protein YckC
MTCGYCGSRNDELDTRCQRCGRRPEDTLNSPVMVHRTSGNLATKPRIVATEMPPARTADLSGAVQANLFTPNVIAMPNRVVPRAQARPKTTTSVANAAKAPVKRAPRPVAEGQGRFEFIEPIQSKPKTLGTTVDAVIYCEAPVAAPLHRAFAAALDFAMVLLAYGMFLATFALFKGEFILNRPNLLIFGGMFMLIAATYGLFWTVAGTETAGMRWTHLRLITFDGFQPEPRQRTVRFLGTCLSMFSILGVLWSIADEEGLGWHDYISRTFPTPHELENRVFRRR